MRWCKIIYSDKWLNVWMAKCNPFIQLETAVLCRGWDVTCSYFIGSLLLLWLLCLCHEERHHSSVLARWTMRSSQKLFHFAKGPQAVSVFDPMVLSLMSVSPHGTLITRQHLADTLIRMFLWICRCETNTELMCEAGGVVVESRRQRTSTQDTTVQVLCETERCTDCCSIML